MRYNRYLYRLTLLAVPITDTVKMSISVADISADPIIGTPLENFVQSCPICQKTLTLSREPLINTPLPSYPWERIAADLFDLKGSTYLLVVDYFSRFVEVQKLNTTTSPSVVTHLKSIFARFGIPATMITDNGPQFKSEEMEEFAQSYGFVYITTSPYYPKLMD